MSELVDDETGMADPGAVVCRELGIKYLLPLQELAIISMLEVMDSGGRERELFCLFPTGMGKTICFLSLVLLRRCLAIVVYPLNALVADQERRIRDANIPVAVLTGSRSKEERRADLAALARDRWGVIITNPETLRLEPSLQQVAKLKPGVMIVDEVHLVEEWGTDFRPAFCELGDIRRKLGIGNLFCFTATLSRKSLGRVCEILGIPSNPRTIRAPLDRSNLFFRTAYTSSVERLIPLLFLEDSGLELSKHVELPALVFCPTRKRTEQMAQGLATAFRSARRNGHQVPEPSEIRYYHAGLSKEERTALEHWFAGSDAGILCCTCAYGTGVDKKNIRTVIHSFAPPSPQAYVQESGRAGRDGQPATGILLRTLGEVPAWVAGYCKPGRCRRSFLTGVLDDELEGCSGCESCTGSHDIMNLDRELIRGIRRFLGKSALLPEDVAVFRGAWPLSRTYLDDDDLRRWGLYASLFDNAGIEEFTKLLKSSRLSDLVDNAD